MDMTNRTYNKICDDNDDDSDMKEHSLSSTISIYPILVVFFLYSVSFTIMVPALPELLLQLTNEKSGKSSLVYGLSISVRYILEFFSSPFLGHLSDINGRKGILLIGLATVTLEFFLLAWFPSIPLVFITRIMSGLSDSTTQMCYAIITDIAQYNDDSVTHYFGTLGATFGFGMIIGPIFGAWLVDVNLQLCFYVSGTITLIAFIVVYFYFIETLALLTSSASSSIMPNTRESVKYSDATAAGDGDGDEKSSYNNSSSSSSSISSFEYVYKSHPIKALKYLCHNRDGFIELAISFSLSSFSTGMYSIWVLYMKKRFNTSLLTTSYFLSTSGAATVIIQGLLVAVIVPTYLNDEKACFYAFCTASVQMLLYGLVTDLYLFYMVMIVLQVHIIYGPSLKSLLSKVALKNEQGILQGALGSIRTISAGVGSFFFTGSYIVSLWLNVPLLYGLPFFLAGGVYAINAMWMYRHMTKRHNCGVSYCDSIHMHEANRLKETALELQPMYQSTAI